MTIRQVDRGWLGTIRNPRASRSALHERGRSLDELAERVKADNSGEELKGFNFKPGKGCDNEKALRTARVAMWRVHEAARLHEEAQEARRVAAQALIDGGITMRDAGVLLGGISHQRVQQILSGK